MQRIMLQAKIHRARVTHSRLDYEGSCAIDQALLDAAGIREYQQIEVYNIINGERFTTYAISAERGSGVISVNGAAAHKARPDDIVIIASYAIYLETELQKYHPTLIYLDERNHIALVGNRIPVQAAG